MQTDEVNPEGYERAAAINYAAGRKGKFLIITGPGETNTHIQIIEGLVDRRIEPGKPFNDMVYPNRDHGLREGNGTLVHVRMLIIQYLLERLPLGASKLAMSRLRDSDSCTGMRAVLLSPLSCRNRICEMPTPIRKSQ